MDSTARDAYLEAQVLTATPQKLRLMLIEGAIRFARQTLSWWDEGKDQEALDALIRCRAIVSELLSSIRIDRSALTGRVAATYLFLYQALTEAQLQLDRKRIDDVIEILEVERETWRQVCEKMPHAPPPDPLADDRAEITSRHAAIHGPGACFSGEALGGGLVLDA